MNTELPSRREIEVLIDRIVRLETIHPRPVVCMALITALENIVAAGRPHGNDAISGEPCGCDLCQAILAAEAELKKALA